ncbi:UDP-GlcNAc3NAcA epimerase [Pseudomonas sp. BIGb0408]|uniref:UDP-GlcNAc3NAcA epimerase n=1 Tax=Phytopseudomonas flavescens TaxID=29435 RepID=A0A7Y9XKY3_9GAMM|nr:MULTISPECIES: UDP-N-acetylglucosamine 2-epimerase (non-hydrolyzing) [Pseudomonas]MCW2292120.1 UDP-GlcNAc3NAcA epimerase [Pseudomonas sp. BIGb0408]NYH73308.1 UDP-GlcNAc3NAcA epimerase [Pseudomonas flavescens]
MKVLTVVGARPQFIKAAVLSRAFLLHGIEEVLVHTGQHYDNDMSDVFFSELSIPQPSYNLAVGGGTHGQNTGRMLEKLEELMVAEKPDWVLVYGDTDSTLAGALAAAKLHIPIAHIEAGLRSFNRAMPEEINRVLTDHVSSLLFSPTKVAEENLLREGIADKKIHVVGDVMYDATVFYLDRAVKPSWFDLGGFEVDEFILCTVHRAENTDSEVRIRNILLGLGSSKLPVILPMHPRTRKKLDSLSISIPDNVRVVSPVGYLEMNWLEANCRLIATDSGGVQKEAYFHKKYCVTMRNETEWVELVKKGVNVLVGDSAELIKDAINSSKKYDFSEFIYGRGDTASKIIDVLVSNAR